MDPPAAPEGAGAGRVDLVGIGLWAFGLYQVALGLFMVVAPGTFFEEVGPFGTRNDHYIRDDATFELPLGLLFIVAAGRPSWRVPALAFGTLHWALHSINHLVDIGDADPSWIGVFDFVALAAGTAVLAFLLWLAASPKRGTG